MSKSKGLQIGADFSLPLEAVTETFAILAKRGMGKTYLAARMVEQMHGAGLPVCVVDPIGVWWGLRTAADGKGAGLPIVILGGDHGDLPLTDDMGDVVANLVIDQRVSVVIDLGNFRKAQQIRFVTSFAETLYHRNREPLHLFLDEADAFAPQRPMKGHERALGAIDDIVRRGRARGLGVTLITQRSAVLNKDVLTQAEVLVTLRTIAPQDRAAIDEWIKVKGTPEQRAQLMASLPSLPVGTAWFWSPGWLDVFQQVKILPRETFDSSATPKMGVKPIKAKLVTDVNLADLRAFLAASLSKAEATDVKALQRKIAELKQLVDAKPAVVAEVKTVEVPIIEDAQIRQLEELANSMQAQADLLLARSGEIISIVHHHMANQYVTKHEQSAVVNGGHRRVQQASAPAPVQVRPLPIIQPLAEGAGEDKARTIKAGAVRMLSALVQRDMPLTRKQLATLSGMSVKSGTFTSYLSNLRLAGFIQEYSDGYIYTADGEAFLGGDVVSMPQTTAALLQMWRGALKAGANRMLECLVSQHPNGLLRQELADSVEMSVTSGTFTSYLSSLRSNGLIFEGTGRIFAHDDLFIDERALG